MDRQACVQGLGHTCCVSCCYDNCSQLQLWFMRTMRSRAAVVTQAQVDTHAYASISPSRSQPVLTQQDLLAANFTCCLHGCTPGCTRADANLITCGSGKASKHALKQLSLHFTLHLATLEGAGFEGNQAGTAATAQTSVIYQTWHSTWQIASATTLPADDCSLAYRLVMICAKVSATGLGGRGLLTSSDTSDCSHSR